MYTFACYSTYHSFHVSIMRGKTVYCRESLGKRCNTCSEGAAMLSSEHGVLSLRALTSRYSCSRSPPSPENVSSAPCDAAIEQGAGCAQHSAGAHQHNYGLGLSAILCAHCTRQVCSQETRAVEPISASSHTHVPISQALCTTHNA